MCPPSPLPWRLTGRAPEQERGERQKAKKSMVLSQDVHSSESVLLHAHLCVAWSLDTYIDDQLLQCLTQLPEKCQAE